MPLQCPRCAVPMTEMTVPPSRGKEQLDIDVCSKCEGLWLDAYEIQRICPTAYALSPRIEDLSHLGQRGQGIARCPRCSAVPVEVSASGLPIDLCDGCGGLWLDKPETEKLTVPHQREAVKAPPKWLAAIASVLDRLYDGTPKDGAWPPKTGIPRAKDS